MIFSRRSSRPARQARRPASLTFSIEALEVRSLLSTDAFIIPANLTPLLAKARQGNIGPIVSTMLGSLQGQLTNGPLVNLGSAVAAAESQFLNQNEATFSSTQYTDAVGGSTSS